MAGQPDNMLKARLARVAAGLAALLFLLLPASAFAASPSVAPTPPMGWNSWDAYGFTITEAQFKANAARLASIRPHGWTYAVIDEGWYMGNPMGADVKARAYLLDPYGRLDPIVSRFPSAADGHGLRALATWTHQRGLKFGVHVVRGIPRAAVEANMPIEGSRFRAADAADRGATCPWDQGNYGIADNAAGQAYYDSLMRQYADWGVDFLKIDCISDHPYRPTEIRQIGRALTKIRRPIVLSLSPGPTGIEHAAEVARWSHMWRIMDDLWDGWTFPHPDPTTTFPNGVRNAFDSLAAWNRHVGPGSWPDADMLPFGPLRPHPGWGDPRDSRLTPAETRTAFTLWSIARSPLILGGDLTGYDPATFGLLTNRAVIALNQQNRTNRPLATLPADMADTRVWTSRPAGGAVDTVAIFNLSDSPLSVDQAWTDLGLVRGAYAVRNLWNGFAMPNGTRLRMTLAPHDVALLRTVAAKPR